MNNMKILYTTDLHGAVWKYDAITLLAKEHKVDMVINGGDMLPKISRDEQGDFILDVIDKHFSRLNDDGIHCLCLLGNDDIKIFDDLFQTTCDKYSVVHNIAQKKVNISGFEFIGFNLVVDYPFRLKDRCRIDDNDFIFPPQHGTGLLSRFGEWKELDDWYSYAKTLPTIEEELDYLVKPDNMSKTIYVMHNSPSNLALDMCYDGRKVGSKAMYEFLKQHQPLMSLHGHIHESPDMTGHWCGKIGDTISIQPGQLDDLTYIIIDLDIGYIKKFCIRNYHQYI